MSDQVQHNSITPLCLITGWVSLIDLSPRKRQSTLTWLTKLRRRDGEGAYHQIEKGHTRSVETLNTLAEAGTTLNKIHTVK
jgi:hypothetical protein